MSSVLILAPAYGRDYDSPHQLYKDWQEGKDFMVQSVVHGLGRYCNRQDAEKYHEPASDRRVVKIRFDRKTRWVHIDLKTGRMVVD